MNDETDLLAATISQKDIILEYFQMHPNKDISHPEIVDYVVEMYKRRTGKVFRDPDRSIRKLHQDGYLVKVDKGIYRYDPALIQQRNLEDFTPAIKKAIFERDNFQFVMCGRGLKDGVEIHAD